VTAAGTTRYLCPLDCGWHYDETPPDFSSPATLPPFVPQPQMEGIDAMVLGFAVGAVAVVEAVTRAHCGTHLLVEWVQAVSGLQRERDRLAAEVRGLEETAAGHHQNAAHWQERAVAAELAARSAASLLRATADRASSGVAINPGVLRAAAKAIDEITSPKET
jgi:hypothetical protein